MRLYRIRYSTNVERVALAHERLPVESIWVKAADRSEVVRVSGQELVPVLEVGDTVVCDSLAILSWLEQHWPEPSLYPPDRARRAELELFLDWFDRVWKRPPNELEAELQRPRLDQARIAALTGQLARALDRFEQLLDGRDYLFGDEFSAADCAAFPFLKYAAMRESGDDELFHRILHQRQPLGDGHPRLAAWIRRVDERPRV